MLSDIEIAESCKLKDIREIAEKLCLTEDNLELYGKYKAKINLEKVNPKSKLILVTAINLRRAAREKRRSLSDLPTVCPNSAKRCVLR